MWIYLAEDLAVRPQYEKEDVRYLAEDLAVGLEFILLTKQLPCAEAAQRSVQLHRAVEEVIDGVAVLEQRRRQLLERVDRAVGRGRIHLVRGTTL